MDKVVHLPGQVVQGQKNWAMRILQAVVAFFTTWNHPPQIVLAFCIEACERFAWYLIMSGLYKEYMKSFGLAPGLAFFLSGLILFNGYLGPAAGGYLADRIGYRRSVLTGCISLAATYYMLSLGSFFWIVAANLGIVVGNGFFKSAMQSLVGGLYKDRIDLRDDGFSIFYQGVNTGAFFSPLASAAALAGAFVAISTNGYQAAFLLAAIGMIVAASLVIIGYKWLAVAEQNAPSLATAITIKKDMPQYSDEQYTQMRKAIFILCAVVGGFFAAFHQNGTSIVELADRYVDLTFNSSFGSRTMLWGIIKAGAIGAIAIGCVNSLFVVGFTPLLNHYFKVRKGAGQEVTTPTKLIRGMGLTVFSFFIFSAMAYSGLNGKVSGWIYIAAWAVLTMAELHLSPMGQSLVSKLSRPNQIGTNFGLYNLAVAVGNLGTGLIGLMWGKMPDWVFFALIAGMCYAFRAILIAFKPMLESCLPKPHKDEMPEPLAPADLDQSDISKLFGEKRHA